MSKKILSIILVVAMLLTVLPLSVFAKDDGKFNYVSIGDSTTNGFGFSSYYKDGKDVRGFNQVVPEAYPALITEMLKKEGKDVELHQFAGSALRNDDLHAILDENHIDDDYTGRVFAGHYKAANSKGEEWFETWGKLIDAGVTDCATGEKVLRDAFRSEIADADLITYYLGSNSFGTFITGALTDNRYGDSDNLQDLLAHLGIPKEQINVAEIRQKFMGFLTAQLANQVDIEAFDKQFGTYVDLFVQSYVGCVVYFTKNIEIIRKLNPDCDIVVVGLHNYVDFLKADFNGQIVDLGDFYGKILELANIYMAYSCPLANDYYYADLAKVDYPIFVKELVDGKPSETAQGYLDEMVGGIAKGVVPALNSYPDKTVGSMLRGWYEKGFTDSDYVLVAGLASSMGLVDATASQTLSGLGLELKDALKLADLYHTGNDAFVPAFDNLLTALSATEPSVSTLQALLKQGNNYISFQTLKTYMSLIEFFGLAQSTGLDGYLTMLDGIGAQLDTFKNYGRVQELLLSCVSTDAFNLNEVLGALNNGLSMDAIGNEVAAVNMGQKPALSDSTKTLINLYFMFMFPNGMGIGAHPNEEGHKVMADTIYSAYKNKTAAKDYMGAKLLDTAAELVDELIKAKGDVTVQSYSDISLESTTVNTYTSLGDSTVFGFGLEDFAVNSKVFADTYGYKACSEYAYPALLAEKLGVESENFNQLSMGSLRVEDILAILKNDTTGDEYYTGSIISLLKTHAGGLQSAHNDYVSSIEKSDLITIAMGGNNFGTFINAQIDRLSSGKKPIALDWTKFSSNELTVIRGAVNQALDMLKQFNGNSQIEMLKVLAETVVYEYVSVIKTYDDVLDEIHRINPKAKIVFLGLFNPVSEVYYQKDGTNSKIKLGKIVDILMANLNKEFRNYAEKNSGYCVFVNTEDAEIFIDTDKSADKNLANDKYVPYITADHGLANHPNKDGHYYMYRQILKALGLKAKDCVYNKTVNLADSGIYNFTLNGHDLGEYEFTKTQNGYLISKEGKYLTFDNNAVGTNGNKSEAYEWKYQNGSFSATVTVSQSPSFSFWFFGFGTTNRTTTYYLTANDDGFAVSQENRNNAVLLTETVENEEHTFDNWTLTETGKHTHICSLCGYSENGECEYTEDHLCNLCGGRDPKYTPQCISNKTVSLTEGKLVFTLGGKEVDEYTFAKSGNGWTIKDKDGKYLAFSNNALAVSDNPFVWTYSSNRFSVSTANTSSAVMWSFGFGGSRPATYYLVYNSGKLAVSTSTANATASFAEKIENFNHTFDENYTKADGEQHYRTCLVCGKEEYSDCVYGKDHLCEVCGRIDPNLVYVTATFETGQDASTAPKSQTVIKDEGKITKPSDPTRIGYLFDGWYLSEELYDFAQILSADITLNAKWAECTEHNYVDDYCTKCGAKDPLAVAFCSGDKKVSLAEGKLSFVLGGTKIGDYTFAKSGNGWTIKDKDGKYLALSNNALAVSDTAFVWNYSSNRFSASVTTQASGGGFGLWSFFGFGSRNTATTYYLCYTGGKLAVSTNTSGSDAEFTVYTESNEHSGKWTTSLKTHTRICEVCGKTETENCQYGEDNKCKVCGGYNPDAVKVEVSVSLSQRSGGNQGFGGIFGFLFGGFGSRTTSTTYTAAITARATGSTVAKTEYSTNDGDTWSNGSTITSNSQIEKFLIRVTDANGKIYNFKYENSVVTEIK